MKIFVFNDTVSNPKVLQKEKNCTKVILSTFSEVIENSVTGYCAENENC